MLFRSTTSAVEPTGNSRGFLESATIQISLKYSTHLFLNERAALAVVVSLAVSAAGAGPVVATCFVI